MITVRPISTTEVLVPNATLVFATDLQGVARDPPPLAILTPRFLPDNQMSARLALDVAETVDHVGMIPGPDGYEVSVPPPLLHLWQLTVRTTARSGSKIRRKPS